MFWLFSVPCKWLDEKTPLEQQPVVSGTGQGGSGDSWPLEGWALLRFGLVLRKISWGQLQVTVANLF